MFNSIGFPNTLVSIDPGSELPLNITCETDSQIPARCIQDDIRWWLCLASYHTIVDTYCSLCKYNLRCTKRGRLVGEAVKKT
jgi:hypothetical protein